VPTTTALVLLRGGEIALPDQGDELGGAFLSKTRNIVRNVLRFGDDKFPIVSAALRPVLKAIETLTGLSLLPQKVKAKKKRKSNSKDAATKPNAETSKHHKTQVNKKEKNKEKKAKASVLKPPTETTKKHLVSKINSRNPNYRIQSELKEFITSPPPNIRVSVGSNIRVWVVTMVGANNTIYEGEVYKLRISFPSQYPAVPPSVYFLKGYIPKHEHVYTNGDICLSLLGKGWRPTMTAQSIAVSILSILSSAQFKTLPMDNAAHANTKPGAYQKDWVYHDDNC
jgi:ubiquitin-conjugating enzyme E2 W